MAIECINSIEIRLFEAPDSDFSISAQACLEGLRGAHGCIDYTLTRSSKADGVWWLTGYWGSQGEMTASFESAAMMRLINCLIEAGASLNFGSFVCLPGSAHGD